MHAISRADVLRTLENRYIELSQQKNRYACVQFRRLTCTSQIFEFACELLRIGGSQKQRDTVAGLRLGTTNQRQAFE